MMLPSRLPLSPLRILTTIQGKSVQIAVSIARNDTITVHTHLARRRVFPRQLDHMRLFSLAGVIFTKPGQFASALFFTA